MSKNSQSGPILNTPYDEPAYHYATGSDGSLDYARTQTGRRIFAPDAPQIPLGQQATGSLFDLNDLAAEYREHIVNQLRDEIRRWRQSSYAGVTSKVTRDLLASWFLDPDRPAWQQLFFAQQEAVETAIWLNEVAQKSNVGTHILNQLALAQHTVGEIQTDWLPRIAFKMATGTGKTVVMACLLLYHYFNRSQYRNDPRYADYFLIVAPGITIRDRLSVLRVDTQAPSDVIARDYYRERRLVPRDYAPLLNGLNAKLVITNFHAFEPRLISGNKKSPFDGKRGLDGLKQEAREDISLVLKRVLGSFKSGRRLLVLNDEAHHCYLPRAKGRDTEDEQSETENERAAIWFSGLRACAERWQVRAVYDLSATPYYLSGSGYPAYSLFPWIVTDYGLVEAIEAGLVKIPFLPVDDTSHAIEEPVLRNLYEHCKNSTEGLPRKGQRTQRAENKKQSKDEKVEKKPVEQPPQLPALLRTALTQFYEHYRKYEQGLREQGERSKDLFSAPPVFIVVCNNTTVSKEVYKEIAGYETEDETGIPKVVPGIYELFSNYDQQTFARKTRPPTLLIDSDALENSGQVNDEFKKVFAPEIEAFKREYRIIHPDKSVEAIEDSDLLREVVNTVGKPDTLGAHIRCVVSVSMLTEGWDANTVSHIVGLRAFGSQLLCEQVAGRALRRRNYFVDPKTGKFPPEYAHIIGVPFKFFRGGQTELPPPQDIKLLRALPDRYELEIKFPNIVGYRIEHPHDEIRADFSGTPEFRIDLTKTPVETILGNAFSEDQEKLGLSDIFEMRDQEVVFWIAQQLLSRLYRDETGRPRLELFGDVRRIAQRWFDTKVELVGEADIRFKRLVRYEDPQRVVASVKLGIDAASMEEGLAGEARIVPIINRYSPEGSTRFVHGATSKDVFPTKKSHVNLVVADTDTWEQIAAKTFERLPQIESYVKNAFLGFEIPYVDKQGTDRRYVPDYLARVKTPDGEYFNLIVEITGFAKEKAEKRYFVNQRWLPAVNAERHKADLPPWYFIEVTDIEHIKKQLTEAIERIGREIDAVAENRFWMGVQASTVENVWGEDDDKLFEPTT